jgi:hypothetical protein
MLTSQTPRIPKCAKAKDRRSPFALIDSRSLFAAAHIPKL